MLIVRVRCSDVDEGAGVEGVLVYGEEVYRDRLLQLQEKGYCVVLVLSRFRELDLTEEELGEAIAQCDDIEGFVNVCFNIEDLSDGYVQRIYARCHGVAAIIYESDRIMVRESIVEDAVAFCALYQDDAVGEYIEAVLGEFEQKEEDYRDYIGAYKVHQYGYYEYGMYSLVLKETNECIGRVGVENKKFDLFSGLSLGYAILAKYRGKGYVTEACRAVAKDCLEQGYSTGVYLLIENRNGTSIAVAQKLGAKYVKSSLVEGKQVDIWELSESDNIV